MMTGLQLINFIMNHPMLPDQAAKCRKIRKKISKHPMLPFALKCVGDRPENKSKWQEIPTLC